MEQLFAQIKKETVKKQQKALSDFIAVSGHEQAIISFIEKTIRPLVDDIHIDPLGSLYGIMHGNAESGQRILLDAHVDEVGFMIQHVEKDGFLRFVPLGGWDTRIFPGLPVLVINNEGNPMPGIIGTTPPHLSKKKDQNQVISMDDLFIDMGFASMNHAQDKGVAMGCVGVPYIPFTEFNENIIQGKAFDDRSGVNILLNLMELLHSHRQEQELRDTIIFSFSVQEEVGLRGAGPAVHYSRPDMALVIENTTAGDVPGIAESQCPARLGHGPAITMADHSMIADREINKRLQKIAQDHNIPFQWKKPIFGGTNAGRIHTQRQGIPTSILSVPGRYIHSPGTIIDINDLLDTLQLLTMFIIDHSMSSISSISSRDSEISKKNKV